MAQTFSPLACLLLVLAAQHSLGDLNEDIFQELEKLNDVLSGSSGMSIGAVIAFLVSEQKNTITEVNRFTTTLDTDLNAAMEELNKANSKLSNTATRLQSAVESSKNPESGTSQSLFVRWGRKTCPDNTAVVYNGIAGGKNYGNKGHGTNYLCLNIEAEYNESTITAEHYSYIDGLQYRIDVASLHLAVVLCSVCLTPLPTTIMIPSTNTCPQGWTSQYTGYLASANRNHFATEFICLDGNPETELGGTSTTTPFSTLFLTLNSCWGLPCPPYEKLRVVTCVVCSKSMGIQK